MCGCKNVFCRGIWFYKVCSVVGFGCRDVCGVGWCRVCVLWRLGWEEVCGVGGG